MGGVSVRSGCVGGGSLSSGCVGSGNVTTVVSGFLVLIAHCTLRSLT